MRMSTRTNLGVALLSHILGLTLPCLPLNCQDKVQLWQQEMSLGWGDGIAMLGWDDQQQLHNFRVHKATSLRYFLGCRHLIPSCTMEVSVHTAVPCVVQSHISALKGAVFSSCPDIPREEQNLLVPEAGYHSNMYPEEYLARIGYKGSHEKRDLETLTAIFQHHIRTIPFENLSIHCGETITLDLDQVYNKIVRKKRGGWCMEQNQLLCWLLQTLGYDTTILGACIYKPQHNAYASHMTHLLLKVDIDDKAYILDGGFGVSYQMWQPMELISGKDQPQTSGIFRVIEDNGIWHFEKIRRKQCVLNQSYTNSDLLERSEYRKIYLFSLEPRTLEDFQFQCTYLQTSPDSLFRKKSICSLQTTNGFRALIGWTLIETTYNYKDNTDLIEFTTLKDEQIEKTLKDKFSITLERKFVPINLKEFYVI